MIATIVTEIERAAKAHKDLNGFTYDLPSKVLGTGERFYPHLFLESPIVSGDFDTETGGVVTYTANICVLCFGGDALSLQTKAENILYQIVSEINRNEVIDIKTISVMGLTRYSDDNTNGVRATLSVDVINDYSRCDVEGVFDYTKEFKQHGELPEISTNGATGCETEYHGKLKKINL